MKLKLVYHKKESKAGLYIYTKCKPECLSLLIFLKKTYSFNLFLFSSIEKRGIKNYIDYSNISLTVRVNTCGRLGFWHKIDKFCQFPLVDHVANDSASNLKFFSIALHF